MAPDEDRGPEPPPEPGPPDGDGMQFSCPECGGVLREDSEGQLPRFDCHVGHRFSFESLIAAHEHGLEQALWTAVRTLEERATLLRRLGDRMTGDRLTRSAASMERQAEEAEQKAELIRRAVELFPPAVATEA